MAKIQNCILSTTHSARNLSFIFDEHLTFSDQTSALSLHTLTHTTLILKSLHWLKINERIQYKLLSLTYKVLTLLNPAISKI